VGAKVEVVTFSWPAHLRYQTEKQRLIWGFKILVHGTRDPAAKPCPFPKRRAL
jgi:hypothetical protein